MARIGLGRVVDDEVGRERLVVRFVVERLDGFPELVGAVLATHVFEHFVGARLHRCVDEVVESVVSDEYRGELVADAVDAAGVGRADSDAELAVDFGAGVVQ